MLINSIFGTRPGRPNWTVQYDFVTNITYFTIRCFDQKLTSKMFLFIFNAHNKILILI